jgi:response regulator NasT
VQKLRILVAEHERVEAGRLKGLLRRLGHKVVGVARNGWEAVALASELQPDLVIVDVRLPVINGIEAARTILTRTAAPIILLTPSASAELVRRAREAGVMAYLVKPVDGRQLQPAIETALARFRELQSLLPEGRDLLEALKGRELMEQARRLLMRWSKIPEAEAFERIEQYRRSAGTDLQEIASRIVKADELLFRRPTLADCLRAILRRVVPAGGLSPLWAAVGRTAHRFPRGWRQKSAISWEG